MGEVKCSPGPWKAIENSWQYTTIYDAHDHEICRLDLERFEDLNEETQDKYEAIQRADAAAIVRACDHDAALRRAKAETNAEYKRVSKAHSQLSETTDYLIRALEIAQPIVCSMLCPSVKKTGEEWSHVQKCDSISLTLRTAKSMYAGYARAAQIEEGA